MRKYKEETTKRYLDFLFELRSKTIIGNKSLRISDLLIKYRLSRSVGNFVKNKFLKPQYGGIILWNYKTPDMSDAYSIHVMANELNKLAKDRFLKKHQQPFTTQEITIPDQSPAKKLSEFTISELMEEIKKRGGTGTLDFVTKLTLTI